MKKIFKMLGSVLSDYNLLYPAVPLPGAGYYRYKKDIHDSRISKTSK